jgi:hypothetical protein
MKKLVDRRAYRFARQTDLMMLTETLLQRQQEKPELAFLAAEIKALETPLEHYSKALVAARNKGIVEVALKNEARNKLVAALELVADAMENHPEASEMLVLLAGFKIHEPLEALARLPIPEVVKTKPTGKRGELAVTLKTWEGRRPRAYLHGCEYSADQGKTWQNGQYKPSQRFVLVGLPPYSSLLVRFRTIAPNGDTSAWSEAAPAVVY